MSRQNVYDNSDFFDGYWEFRDEAAGLHHRVLEPHLDELLPDLVGKRVVDVGCGDGWLCRIARERGAREVQGIDPSSRMLQRARELTSDPCVTYTRGFVEDAEMTAGAADVVTSVLALHYVEEIASVLARMASWLAPAGTLLAVVEHPIVTSQNPKVGLRTVDGAAVWPVDDYFAEGERKERWIVDGVVKYHRRLDTILNAVISAGLAVERVDEPRPSTDRAEPVEVDADADAIRPAILAIRARKR
jgi:SAM-dependent methyltransferase